MTEKLNYLRFMSFEELSHYLDDNLEECKNSWRENEPPMFYFFGVEESSLDSIDLGAELGDGLYWIASSMAYDLCHGVENPRHEFAVLFHGDGSLQKEEYEDGLSLCENEYKTENYNHLQWLDIKVCNYIGGRQTTIVLESLDEKSG